MYREEEKEIPISGLQWSLWKVALERLEDYGRVKD
jgi:hypothetical protein